MDKTLQLIGDYGIIIIFLGGLVILMAKYIPMLMNIWIDRLKENEISVDYYYKKTTDIDYVKGETPLLLNINNNNFSITEIEIKGDEGANGFNSRYTYDILLKLKDELEEVQDTCFLKTGKPPLVVALDGVSMGMPYDETLGGALQINGDAYVNGNKIITQNIITAITNGRPVLNIATAYASVKIPLDTATEIGDKLIFDNINDRVVIGSGVSIVKVSANCCILDPSVTFSDAGIQIKKNGQTVFGCPGSQTGVETNYSIASRLLEVEENDYLEIFWGSNGIGSYTVYGDGINSYMTVEVVG